MQKYAAIKNENVENLMAVQEVFVLQCYVK